MQFPYVFAAGSPLAEKVARVAARTRPDFRLPSVTVQLSELEHNNGIDYYQYDFRLKGEHTSIGSLTVTDFSAPDATLDPGFTVHYICRENCDKRYKGTGLAALTACVQLSHDTLAPLYLNELSVGGRGMLATLVGAGAMKVIAPFQKNQFAMYDGLATSATTLHAQAWPYIEPIGVGSRSAKFHMKTAERSYHRTVVSTEPRISVVNRAGESVGKLAP